MTDHSLQKQRQAMTRRLQRRTACEGKFSLPAVPSMLADYVERCAQLFATQGRPLTGTEREHLRTVLEQKLHEAFAGSQRSSITIAYSARVGEMLRYSVTAHTPTLMQMYDEWVQSRQPPYFGVHADAKVLALANDLTDPATAPILDIGAGTGRNAIALARRGHPVDAIEPAPKFADILRDSIKDEKLTLRIMVDDVFRAAPTLRQDYQLIVVSEVTPDFRSAEEWRKLLELAAHHLADGGKLVVNVFATNEYFYADEAAREFAQQVYSFFLTPPEIVAGGEGLPLALVASEPTYDYEKSALPPDAWPPTPWYPDWVRGRDVFDLPAEQCPVALHWLVWQKDWRARRDSNS